MTSQGIDGTVDKAGRILPDSNQRVNSFSTGGPQTDMHLHYLNRLAFNNCDLRFVCSLRSAVCSLQVSNTEGVLHPTPFRHCTRSNSQSERLSSFHHSPVIKVSVTAA